jgi:hypothetical protein
MRVEWANGRAWVYEIRNRAQNQKRIEISEASRSGAYFLGAGLPEIPEKPTPPPELPPA